MSASDVCLEAQLHEFSDGLPPCEKECFEEDFLGNRRQPGMRGPKSQAARKRRQRVRAKGQKFFEGP
jgi:hypothetical protein